MKDMKQNKTDELLREAFKSQLPQAPKSPWFTRKVMNRLPQRHRRHIYIIEWIGYIVAVAILIAYWIGLYRDVTSAKVITMNDVITICVLVFMTVPLFGIMAINLFKRV